MKLISELFKFFVRFLDYLYLGFISTTGSDPRQHRLSGYHFSNRRFTGVILGKKPLFARREQTAEGLDQSLRFLQANPVDRITAHFLVGNNSSLPKNP